MSYGSTFGQVFKLVEKGRYGVPPNQFPLLYYSLSTQYNTHTYTSWLIDLATVQIGKQLSLHDIIHCHQLDKKKIVFCSVGRIFVEGVDSSRLLTRRHICLLGAPSNGPLAVASPTTPSQPQQPGQNFHYSQD